MEISDYLVGRTKNARGRRSERTVASCPRSTSGCRHLLFWEFDGGDFRIEPALQRQHVPAGKACKLNDASSFSRPQERRRPRSEDLVPSRKA